MKIFLTGPHAYSSVHNEPDLTLVNFLEEKGWQMAVTASEAEAILALEVPVTRLFFASLPKNTEKIGMLVVQEPSVVRPLNHSQEILSRFARLISVGRVSQGRATPWPALYLDRFSKNSSLTKLRQACMIAGNKVSFIHGELYSLRRAVLRRSDKLDLFGTYWDSKFRQRIKQVLYEIANALTSKQLPKVSSMKYFLGNWGKYLGPVTNKLEVNSLYKVSVVIENSTEYMSEKLLEAIAAGSIPVYVGPDVQDFGIPSGLVIQVPPRVEAVLDGIDRALEMDYDTWVANCQKWLSDPEVKEFWSLQSLWNRIHSELLELAGEAKSGNPSNF